MKSTGIFYKGIEVAFNDWGSAARKQVISQLGLGKDCTQAEFMTYRKANLNGYTVILQCVITGKRFYIPYSDPNLAVGHQTKQRISFTKEKQTCS